MKGAITSAMCKRERTLSWSRQSRGLLPIRKEYCSNAGFANQEHRTALDVVYPITYYPGSSDASGATPITVKPGEHASADMTLATEPAQHFKVSDPDVGQSQGMNVLLQQRVFDGLPSMCRHRPWQVLRAKWKLRESRRGITGCRCSRSERIEHPRAGSGYLEWHRGTSEWQHNSLGSDWDCETAVNGRRADCAAHECGHSRHIRRAGHEKGRFKIDSETMAPGKYEVEVLNLEHAVVRSVSSTGARASGQTLEISGGGPVRLTVTLAEQLSRVDGIALRDGKGVGGAMIVLVPQDLEHNVSLARRDRATATERFLFTRFLRGSTPWSRSRMARALEWQDRNVIAPYVKSGSAIEVGPERKVDAKVTVQ